MQDDHPYHSFLFVLACENRVDDRYTVKQDDDDHQETDWTLTFVCRASKYLNLANRLSSKYSCESASILCDNVLQREMLFEILRTVFVQ